jgi:acyl CoA:acetate/3-ketoacid CoA transferase beta subunit
MRQDSRKCVGRVDFITTPGYLTGPGAREKAGLPAGGGPYRVITQLGVYGFDDQTREMRLVAIHPGVTREDLRANSGFDVAMPDDVTVSPVPTPDDRRILREIDPAGLVIQREK